MTEIPYTHDDLGEDNYRTRETPTQPDRHIDTQEAHVPFYSKQGPPPFGA